ncbi:MAG: DUF3604 domain-containing protein [Gammaproteobacteria bacterium]|nr:DUF3604 domain-containing protein [Gammaproteobacteria bacterium]
MKPANNLSAFLLIAVSSILSGCDTSEPTVTSTPTLSEKPQTVDDSNVADSKSKPSAKSQHPVRPLWGDLHLHTQWSADTGLFGTVVDPEQSLRFARGEEITSNTGQRVKLDRPLDFLAITEHAEYLGLTEMLNTADPLLLASPTGKEWYERYKKLQGTKGKEFQELVWEILFGTDHDVIDNPKMVRSVWERFIAIIEKYHEPGKFSTLAAYEWTSIAGKRGDNLHRNVIFRDNPARTTQVVPFSSLDSMDPEHLWEYMAAYEDETGGQVLAIPHNGNLSNGLMFPWPGGETKRVSGAEVDAKYVAMRQRWEPLYEVVQIKGDGESHPLLSPNDEFADFETWDTLNVLSVPNRPELLPGQYAREAYKQGLKWQQLQGINPYKFGLVGATDSHNGLSATREDNYWGKFIVTEPSPIRYKYPFVVNKDRPELTIYAHQETAAGLTAVWATENNRAPIFDALKRKETYASTGTRIGVRIFAGWDFNQKDLQEGFVEQGYARGVPMGGDLKQAPAGASPRIMIQAVKDVIGANLDRVQVVKGWLDAKGQLQERVYDAAVSDGRQINVQGRCETPVGSTVDLSKPSYQNTIGDPTLEVVWSDPDFDPKLQAFYYVRVIEIPTPRWTSYDEVRYGISMPDVVKRTVQDRAYTSPIWYTP